MHAPFLLQLSFMLVPVASYGTLRLQLQNFITNICYNVHVAETSYLATSLAV